MPLVDRLTAERFAADDALLAERFGHPDALRRERVSASRPHDPTLARAHAAAVARATGPTS